jgi:cobalt-zinc-cadmium efflux system outer membrane protein
MLRFAMLLLLATVLTLPVAAQEEELGGTVAGLLEYAARQNPEYAALQAEAAALQERIAPSGALPDPMLRTEFMDLTRFGGRSDMESLSRYGSTRITLMQDVPWFGKRGLRTAIARDEAEGAEGMARGGWADIAGRIKMTFAEAYYLQGDETLAREILDLLARLEDIAAIRYANGQAPMQDAIRAQVEQTNLRNELIELETERHHAHLRMNALLARPGNAPLAAPQELPRLPSPEELDFALLQDRARANNPELFTDETRIQAAEKTRDLTYRNRYPDFKVGVGLVQYQTDLKEWEMMVEFNIPLQQRTRRAQEGEAEAMLTAAKARKSATENEVSAELARELTHIDTMRRIETLVSESLLPQAELTYQAALAGYETGKVDFATLLEAQRQIREARRNRLKAQADARISLAAVERLVGEDL